MPKRGAPKKRSHSPLQEGVTASSLPEAGAPSASHAGIWAGRPGTATAPHPGDTGPRVQTPGPPGPWGGSCKAAILLNAPAPNKPQSPGLNTVNLWD